MPHVRRSMLITIDADRDRVRRALVDELELTADDGPATRARSRGMPDTTARLDAHDRGRTTAVDRGATRSR